MANWVQKSIYCLSNSVPLIIFIAIVWWIQYKTWFVPIILLGIAIFVTTIFFFAFWCFKKNLSVKRINVTSISCKDNWVIGYVIAYLLPFTSLMISDVNIVVLLLVCVFLGLVMISAISSLPNMLLYMFKYHFYEIGTDEISDFLLISKRKIRSKDNIKTVSRVFEKLIIDTKERD